MKQLGHVAIRDGQMKVPRCEVDEFIALGAAINYLGNRFSTTGKPLLLWVEAGLLRKLGVTA